jgi:hypothetical protein
VFGELNLDEAFRAALQDVVDSSGAL